MDRGAIDQESSETSLLFQITPQLVKELIRQTIDKLMQDFLMSSEDQWRKPAGNRIEAMINKVEELESLFDAAQYLEAYSKLLHDIKPKLAGLKEDEDDTQADPFENSWVINSALREEFEDVSKALLYALKFISAGSN